MNVLVYAGPEALQTSVAHALTSLRTILLPQYSVQTVISPAVNSQPWKSSCVLFALPQCHKALPATSSASIRDYVETGGSVIGFGAGAILSDKELGGAATVSNDLLLGFFDKPTGKYVYITHSHEKDLPNASHTLNSSNGEVVEGIHGRGSGEFTGFDNEIDRNVLARFTEKGSGGSVAGLIKNIGQGKAGIWASNVEVPSTSGTPDADERRLQLLRSTLLSLSLQLPSAEEFPVSSPFPQFLTSTPKRPDIVPIIADFIASPASGAQLSVFKDDNDTFHFHSSTASAGLLRSARENTAVVGSPLEWQPKHIVLSSTSLPEQDQTPLFDLAAYYDSLNLARKAQGCPELPDAWGCGEALLYGEVVTSTQTMLDNKLVFIQYLFALAVVEACRDDAVLGKWGKQVRLKWPNDIYAVVDGERKKVGGILVNTNFSGGKVDIVVGCGLNVLNAAPIFSLVQLLSPEGKKSLTLEKTASNILARFEKMWETFVQERGSFDSFMTLYLERWLHSDQLVTLTTVTPPQLVRITGITPDHGLLRTMPERNGWSSGAHGFIDLQPDGNSFDIMAGLIKSKT
ncbi:hypothetical protein DXG01_008690 [Tephrocybe rancida]|nr:hypothetical protein DXG01_008690 [Tephrocybe rancida]